MFFRQVIGIPVGANCAPLLADLFLCSCESEFLDNVVGGDHRRLARLFSLCCRCMGGLIVFNGRGFGDCVREICPSQLAVGGFGASGGLVGCLDLAFVVESNDRLCTGLCNKRGGFGFHIVGFPFLSGGVPSISSCGVCVSQLVGCVGCCSCCGGFGCRRKLLVGGLLSRGCEVEHLEIHLRIFVADVLISLGGVGG